MILHSHREVPFEKCTRGRTCQCHFPELVTAPCMGLRLQAWLPFILLIANWSILQAVVTSRHKAFVQQRIPDSAPTLTSGATIGWVVGYCNCCCLAALAARHARAALTSTTARATTRQALKPSSSPAINAAAQEGMPASQQSPLQSGVWLRS